MRKYFLSIVALVGMLFATSCQESLVEPQVGGTTTFTVQVPDQMGTKAIGGHDLVNKLYVEVYAQGDIENVIYKTTADKKQDGSFEVSINLIQDQHYSIIFWAQKEGAYIVENLRSIPMNVNHHNNESGAAFYAYLGDFVPSGTTQTVTLKRPFAQLNLGTTPASLKTDVQSDSLELSKSYIKVGKIAQSFNTIKGYGEGSQEEVMFSLADVPDEKLYVAGEKYYYVSMDYLPIEGDNEALVTVNAVINLGNGQSISHNFTNVPVKENHRTNIVGNLISSTTDFIVEVNDDWAGEDYNVNVWDGRSIEIPSYDDATKTYSISNGSQLAWLAATVSGDPLTRSENKPNSLAGKTVKLTDDIYLGENEWKPIGMGGKHFEGIFDGQGHTIYGLKVGSRYSGTQAALFCSAAGSAQFKDFTIDGAKIIYPKDGKDYYAAGVVGTIYGNLTFENIIVKNSRITGNNKVAGLIAHDGTSTQITIDNCHILDSYIASEDLKDGGCVGGMIGYYATGVAGKENNISNSSVEGCTIVGVNSSNSGKRANSEFIGSIMTKIEMVLNITDCILERNTFTQTINGTDPVTYLSAFNPQYIGGDREEKTLGTITISINGETPAVRVTSSEQLQKVVNSATTDITVEFANDLEGKIILYQKEGVKVTIDGKEKTYTGGIQIFGDNRFTDYEMEIKNINFVASGIDKDLEGCIYVTDNNDQWNCNARNVTIQDCTFAGDDNIIAAIRQTQGGTSQDWTIKDCEVSGGMHSFLQINNMSGLRVDGCTVKSKNGANLNQTVDASFNGCNFDVSGYAVRVGVNQSGNTAQESFTFENCIFKSANEDGDAVVIIRTTAQNAELYFENTELIGNPKISGYTDATQIDGIEVAKVGNTEYYSIDEAIAAWTNNTTLTLLADVTLSDVIKISSTEMHTLDLGTYTMTAAKGKDAIEIVNNGRSSASYALDIKADANNPGGITATSKAVVKTTGKSGVKDRPIIRFYNGVFNASNIISHSGSNGTNCPQFQFHGGVYNASMSANRAMIQIYGGTFNGKFYISVDSSAYALIAGGKFKYMDNLYGSALNSDKFTIGSSKGVFDRGVYVDDEGYIVVGGPVITEFGDMFAAKATNVSKAGTYLPYSSAAANGLYYTNADMAITKHEEANVVLK